MVVAPCRSVTVCRILSLDHVTYKSGSEGYTAGGKECRVAYDPDNTFAKILRGEIPSDRVYEDDEFIAFRDVAPQAPVHILMIPRPDSTGVVPSSPADLADGDAPMVGRLVVTATRIAAAQGLDQAGYRLVMNCGDHGGQTVFHLHLHILGGRQLGSFG